ncbi:hypothetical protein TNCV_977751 [Trichonephila clavipes]|nr:hypothetical protein TNCV_977751 [Trichonephila clavipes]
MKCANCSGEHAANWSRCPKHPNNSKRKNKNVPKPKNQNNNNKKSSTPGTTTEYLQGEKSLFNLDYSKVVQNLIPREHVSPPTTLAPLHRPPSKDASVNAGLLKDLLVIIEDTPLH